MSQIALGVLFILLSDGFQAYAAPQRCVSFDCRLSLKIKTLRVCVESGHIIQKCKKAVQDSIMRRMVYEWSIPQRLLKMW